MPYFALTPDYDERTSLTTYRMAFSIGLGMVGFTVPVAMVGSFEPQNVDRMLTMGLTFGALSALPQWITFVGTREVEDNAEAPPPSLRQSLRAARQNRPFLFILGMFLLSWVAVDLMMAVMIYLVKHVLVREPEGDFIMGSLFAAALVSLPLWLYLSERLDKGRAFAIGCGLWAAAQLLSLGLGADSALAAIIAVCGVAGLGVGAVHVLPWAVIPDAVEYDEAHTGQRHEGMFYSLITLARKVAASLAVPGALLLVAAVALALACPLNREEHARLRAGLEARTGAAS